LGSEGKSTNVKPAAVGLHITRVTSQLVWADDQSYRYLVSQSITTSTQFFLSDYDSTLFPLKINRLMIEKGSREILEFIQSDCLADGKSFQNQHRVYATKRGWFLRPTVKLDPAADLFMYDFVYRNRSLFTRLPPQSRNVFGYRIAGGVPISGMQSYRDYKRAVARCKDAYQHYACLDVASYFNRIYHHDLTAWWEEAGGDRTDATTLGKFLREATGGRSIDCLPQGIYPSKMIGSAFLNFLENSSRIRCAESVRLMDDFWMFDNDPEVLIADFLVAQTLLSDRGLSINEQKSGVIENTKLQVELPLNLDDMKIRLLQRRSEELIQQPGYDNSDDNEDDEEFELNAEEHEYLLSLLGADHIAEEDAELVLRLLEDHSSDVLDYLPTLIRTFPGLAKRMYYFCGKVHDKHEVATVLLNLVTSGTKVTEYQLFWFGMMVEDYLLKTPKAGPLLMSLFEHQNATDISKAKILEIPEKRFGLPDLRAERLRSGHSDWPVWAAAIGSRTQPKSQRNQLLKYFCGSSPMNRLVGEFVERVF
jgi:hypothetical protein